MPDLDPQHGGERASKPRKRLLWGFGFVFVPLLILMLLQYRWLSQLQHNSAIAKRAMLDEFAIILAKKVKLEYWELATRHLDYSATDLDDTCPDLFKAKRSEDLAPVTSLFATNMAAQDPYHVTLDPATGLPAKVHMDPVFWEMLIATNQKGNRDRFIVDNRNPNDPIVLKPIFRDNDNTCLAGVVGMVLNPEYLEHVILPQAIEGLLNDTPEAHTYRLEIRNGTGRPIIKIGGGRPTREKAYRNLAFAFTDWQIALATTNQSAAQWARTNFIVNLSLSSILALTLLIGVIMALRIVAREMRLSQMKSDFVSNVSHELRTPLSSVRAFGELLRHGKVTQRDKVREYGEYIETESRRLSRLIDNILDFSKIESGQKVYSPTTVDIREMVTKTVTIFQIRLSRQDLSVHLRIDYPLPEVVLMDPDAISQAIANLLDNAVKYSHEGKRIDVRLYREDDTVVISVKDQGIGIPEGDHGLIFERFHRVSTGLVHNVKGSGLGLAIVEHIMRAHDGTVSVRSRLGEGATFFLHIPIKLSQTDGSPSLGINKMPT